MCFSKCQWFISSLKHDWPKFLRFSRDIFHPNPVQPGEFTRGFTHFFLTLWTWRRFFPQLFGWWFLFFGWLRFVCLFRFVVWLFCCFLFVFFFLAVYTVKYQIKKGKTDKSYFREIAGWLLSLLRCCWRELGASPSCCSAPVPCQLLHQGPRACAVGTSSVTPCHCPGVSCARAPTYQHKGFWCRGRPGLGRMSNTT